MGVKLLEAPPSVAELRRRPAEELHGLIEDMIKVLEAKVLPDLRRGRYPDKRTAKPIAEAIHAVARELELLGSHGMAATDYPAMLARIAGGDLDPALLIGRRIGLAEAATALPLVPNMQIDGMTIIDPTGP